MPLEDWQQRLNTHFTQLATARSKSGLPLFALEHGLSEHEIEEIGKLLRSQRSAGLRLGEHWLAWVVYATELGYDYDGDEYWDSFEERTPQWRERGGRPKILSDWFSRFQTSYQGVKPSGRWAAWFSNIAWPITHAILPKYLQRQFAKALFDLRYRLVRLENLSPIAVGRLLAANAWETSSRFREFLQQEELAGRIVLALLSDREVEDQSPLFLPTLRRLVADLEQVQSSREWLKETRRFVADRLKGAGGSPKGTSAGRDVRDLDRTDGTAVSRGLRPTLMLRRSGASTWTVILNIPSFLGAARLNPELREFLSSTRCKVLGAGDTWLPTGWLFLRQRRVLKSWPGTNVPLVKFERTDRLVGHLVDNEARIPAQSNWVCRIEADGLAREVAGRIVRPGRKYVLLSESTFPPDHSMLDRCGVDCEGLCAAVLSIPEALSSSDIACVQQLGLQVARTVRIWPAGLSARGWDGEGHSEWLTTETPCFGIIHDHPLDTFSVRLDDGAEIPFDAGPIGVAVFVRISPLRAGAHTLFVKAHRGDHSVAMSSPAAEGVVSLDVREPEPWIPGTSSHAGLVISLDQNAPSLDAFWEGNVGVSILGPEARRVTCAVSLANARGIELLSEEVGTFDLPVSAGQWLRKFSRFVKDERRAWTYLEAASGQFSVRGDELGGYALRLERDVKPVRWVCRSIHKVTTVRLIDDSGRDDTATCRIFGFRRPAMSTHVSAETASAGFQIASPGGLIEARNGEFLDSMIVSTAQIEGGLQGLDIEPDFRDLGGGNIRTRRILELLRIWSEARLMGPLVGMRRNRVVGRLSSLLYSSLCGRRWAEAEAAYLYDRQSAAALQRLEQSVGGLRGFAVVLLRGHDRMEDGTGPGTEWYAEVAAEYNVCSERGLCEFALRLASQPHKALLFPEAQFDGLLDRIAEKATLLRGARLLALVAASQRQDSDGAVFPRWNW